MEKIDLKKEVDFEKIVDWEDMNYFLKKERNKESEDTIEDIRW